MGFRAEGTAVVENANLYAQAGAVVEFPFLTRLTGPVWPEGRNAAAEGVGSVLDLSSVEFLDGGNSIGLAARNGGLIKLNGLVEKTLGLVELRAESGGSLEATNLSNFAGGALVVETGGVLDLPRLSSASNVHIYARSGSTLPLPSLTRLTGPAWPNGSNLGAEGTGSVLDLSSLVLLEGGNSVACRATATGRILIPQLPGVTTGRVQIDADGEGSLADFSSLHSLVPDNGSGISAANGGVVALPADFNDSGIEFTGVTPGIVHPVAPYISQQPADQTVPLGGAAVFAVVADGTQPITYRWQIEATQDNWQNISGQTSSTLTLADVHFGKEGRYRCILVNYGGLVMTRAAQLRVGDVNTAPSVVAVPDQEFDELAMLDLTLTATDADLPANAFTFALVEGPAGLTVSLTGSLIWTPAEGQAPSTNTVTAKVTDDGIPALSGTNSFVVVVRSIRAPLLEGAAVAGEFVLSWESVPGGRYQVQFKDDLGAPGWTDLGPVRTAVEARLSARESLGSEAARYYRVLRLAE